MEKYTKYIVQFATNDRADFGLWITLASELFDGFTWQEANGFWKGEGEISYKLEIIPTPASGDIAESVFYLARYIKKTYRQEAVLVSTEEINVAFV